MVGNQYLCVTNVTIQTMNIDQNKVDRYKTTLASDPSIRKMSYKRRAKMFGLPIGLLKRLSVETETTADYIFNPRPDNQITNMHNSLIQAYLRDEIGLDEALTRIKEGVAVKTAKTAEEYAARNYKNWLFIGDLHTPFTDPGYLDFCKHVYDRFNLEGVVFMGDITDGHAISFHTKHPDLPGALDELKKAANMLREWHKVFPEAVVLVGNHDRLNARKVMDAGLPSIILKPEHQIFKELDVDLTGWHFTREFDTGETVLIHGDGDGKNMRTKLIEQGREMKSIAQGHYHQDTHVTWLRGGVYMMQVGCGVDRDSKAMGYAGRGVRKYKHSVGVHIASKDPRYPPLAFPVVMD